MRLGGGCSSRFCKDGTLRWRGKIQTEGVLMWYHSSFITAAETKHSELFKPSASRAALFRAAAAFWCQKIVVCQKVKCHSLCVEQNPLHGGERAARRGGTREGVWGCGRGLPENTWNPGETARADGGRPGRWEHTRRVLQDSLFKFFLILSYIWNIFFEILSFGLLVPPNPCGPVSEKSSVVLTWTSLISMSWLCLLQCWTWRTTRKCWATWLCLWRDWRPWGPSWRTKTEPAQDRTSVGAGTSADPSINICITDSGVSTNSLLKPENKTFLYMFTSLLEYFHFFYQLC